MLSKSGRIDENDGRRNSKVDVEGKLRKLPILEENGLLGR